MPWKDTCAMDERTQFIGDWLRGEEGIAALCRAYGISRKTGYKWIARYQAAGAAGLLERSRAPRRHPQAVGSAVEALLLAARAAHPTWGPRKLLAWLAPRRPDVALPAASTVGEVLRRAGLVVPRRRRARTPPWTAPLAHAAGPNAVWCADFKGQFRVGEGTLCYPLTISDACSRFLVRCQALPAIEGARVRPLFDAAFREYGLPAAIRTDNGPPFASTALGGLTPLSVWWVKLGILPERIAPGHPEQNGRHERLHRTLKRETALPPHGPAATLRAQQRAFDRFRAEYNHERPHEALAQRPPASAYTPSARPYPSRLPPLEYPDADAVRWVRHNGQLRWQGRLLYLSEALAGEPVGLTALDERHWQIAFGPLCLGVLDGATGRVTPAAPAAPAAPPPETSERS
jgi:transposase InsO family protein